MLRQPKLRKELAAVGAEMKKKAKDLTAKQLPQMLAGMQKLAGLVAHRAQLTVRSGHHLPSGHPTT